MQRRSGTTLYCGSCACYRSGAYRSAIVATWIAVCYDVIDKLRELALSGDIVAEQRVGRIERARVSHDLAQSLRFEHDILNLARDQFALISPLEYIDLSRLQEDRNRCAHPSLISQDQGFNPPGELARLHIRSAVLHLLQHQPVQGKYALERLLREVHSEYFPDTASRAVQALSSGPLKRPRDSLVRNFVVILLKDVLNPTLDWKQRRHNSAALLAVKQLHPRIFEATLEEILPALFRGLSDKDIHVGIRVLIDLEDCWNMLPIDVRLKFENFVELLPEEHFDQIEEIICFTPLKIRAEKRTLVASREDIRKALFFEMPTVIANRCIALYLQSDSYAKANEWSAEFRLNARTFSAEQQERILTGIQTNGQVLHSNAVASVINSLRRVQKNKVREIRGYPRSERPSEIYACSR